MGGCTAPRHPYLDPLLLLLLLLGPGPGLFRELGHLLLPLRHDIYKVLRQLLPGLPLLLMVPFPVLCHGFRRGLTVVLSELQDTHEREGGGGRSAGRVDGRGRQPRMPQTHSHNGGGFCTARAQRGHSAN